MKNTKKSIIICSVVILFCLIMAVVDGILKSNYVVKSAIKLAIFLGFPLLYAFFDKELEIKSIFRLRKKDIGFAVGLGVGVFVVFEALGIKNCAEFFFANILVRPFF